MRQQMGMDSNEHIEQHFVDEYNTEPEVEESPSERLRESMKKLYEEYVPNV